MRSSILAAAVFAITSIMVVQSQSSGTMRHPVRQEIVDEIKSRTKSWVPVEIQDNKFRDVPVEQLLGKLGYMGHTSSLV